MAQTGPAGVGNTTSNVIWFSGDHGVTNGSGVSAWADRSGNANHATQLTANLRPVFQANAFNGYPALVFDNSETAADFLRVPDNATLEGMNGLTAFAVYDLFDGTPVTAPRGILSKRVSPTSNVAYGWFHWNSGGNVTQHMDIDGTSNRVQGGIINTNTAYVNGFRFQGSSPSNSQNQVLYMNGTAVANGPETSVSVPDYASDFYIGSLYGHTGTGSSATRFNGRIAEVIVYRTALNDAQRIIVQNYLSAKYGTLLSSGDLYTMDDPMGGNFDHDVAGIGRTSSASIQNDSKGSGIIRINNPTGLNDGEFMFWGHDNGMLGSWGVADRPTSVQGRFQRVWRISEVTTAGEACDVGAVDITFDLNGLGPVDPAHLRLLVDTNGNGLFFDDVPISGALDAGGGNYRFSGITALVNGRRFTLATTNITSTPLPVELVSFEGWPAGNNAAELTWTTASEQNSDHFRVERSIGTNEWQEVGQLPASGSSMTVRDYRLVDGNAPEGVVYYRLMQYDFDGTGHEKGVVAVNIKEAMALSIYPNPADQFITIRTGRSDASEVELLDHAGRAILRRHMNGEREHIDLSGLPMGHYLIRVRYADGGSSAGTLVVAPQ